MKILEIFKNNWGLQTEVADTFNLERAIISTKLTRLRQWKNISIEYKKMLTQWINRCLSENYTIKELFSEEKC